MVTLFSGQLLLGGAGGCPVLQPSSKVAQRGSHWTGCGWERCPVAGLPLGEGCGRRDWQVPTLTSSPCAGGGRELLWVGPPPGVPSDLGTDAGPVPRPVTQSLGPDCLCLRLEVPVSTCCSAALGVTLRMALLVPGDWLRPTPTPTCVSQTGLGGALPKPSASERPTLRTAES